MTIPPTVTQAPSGLLAELGEGAVDPGAQRVADFGQRVRGEVGAERLLLQRQQLGAVELGGRDRRAVVGLGRRPAPRPSSPSPKSKIEPWPSWASSWAFWPADWAAGSASSIPCRVAPVESRAPHLIRHSIARLLTARESTRSQKSQIEAIARVLAGPQDRLDRRVADVLDRVEAEADRLLGDDEAVVGGVDVGRQHVDPHLLAAVDEERDLVLGVHHRGDHRRHVLGRVVGLQVGGPVGDQPVAGGVGLVEGVVGGRFVQLPEVLGDVAARCPRPPAPP